MGMLGDKVTDNKSGWKIVQGYPHVQHTRSQLELVYLKPVVYPIIPYDDDLAICRSLEETIKLTTSPFLVHVQTVQFVHQSCNLFEFGVVDLWSPSVNVFAFI